MLESLDEFRSDTFSPSVKHQSVPIFFELKMMNKEKFSQAERWQSTAEDASCAAKKFKHGVAPIFV